MKDMAGCEKKSSNDSMDHMYETALMAGSMAEPVRLYPSTDGCFVYSTSKGENCTGEISEHDEENVNAFLEELLRTIHKEEVLFARRNGDFTDIHDDGSDLCVLRHSERWATEAGENNLALDVGDLTTQLDPSRAVHIVNNILAQSHIGVEMRDIMELTDKHTDPRLALLKHLYNSLNMKCIARDSCAYKTIYPHVNQPGPVALPSRTMIMLTLGVNFFSLNHDSLVSLVEAALSNIELITMENKTSAYCMCCLLLKQHRGYISIKEEMSVLEKPTEGIKSTLTLLGISEFCTAPEQIHCDMSVPIIDVSECDRKYLDVSKLPFDKYRIYRDDTFIEGDWTVSYQDPR